MLTAAATLLTPLQCYHTAAAVVRRWHTFGSGALLSQPPVSSSGLSAGAARWVALHMDGHACRRVHDRHAAPAAATSSMQLQSPGRMTFPLHARVPAMSCWSQHDSRVAASLQLNISAQLRSSVYLLWKLASEVLITYLRLSIKQGEI